ncbi:MAG: hypothetical protein ABI685_06575 [Ferruginibacter sp.]
MGILLIGVLVKLYAEMEHICKHAHANRQQFSVVFMEMVYSHVVVMEILYVVEND